MKDFQIFKNAPNPAPPEELEAYLDEACGNDPDLRARVDELFQAHDTTTQFMDVPALEPIKGEQSMMVGPYKLLQKVGEGGFGEVYMADQVEPVKRRVAIKIIKAGMDTRQVIARFEAERQALAMMDHANIARVYDAGQTEEGRPYFVMELVKGIPITDYCVEEKLSVESRLKLFTKVCNAVQHAHTKGIIHRDIKPSNVMVTVKDGEPEPKVIDFGIAKATEQHRLTDKTLFTRYEQMIGTPTYMSPEQAALSGVDVDTRCDIYALGVLLYELLTGTTPFDARTLRSAAFDEMRRMIREEDPPRPSTRVTQLRSDGKGADSCARIPDASIESDLDWIVMKCLEKDRQRRYETANGLAMDIDRFVADEPVLARPPSRVYRLEKLVQRNKLAFASSAAVLVALLAGFVVASWGYSQASRERDEAREARAVADQERAAAEAARSDASEQRDQVALMAEQKEHEVYTLYLARANRAIEERNFTRARSELEACPRAQRGWEWNFLRQRLETTIPMIFPGVMKPVFAKNGKEMIAFGVPSFPDEHKALVWDVASGDQLAEFAHGDRLSYVALAPNEIHLACGTITGELTLWEREPKRRLWTKSVNSDEFDGLAFNREGDLLAAANRDGTLRVFHVADGSEVFDLSFPDEKPRRVQFSPDGHWIVMENPPVVVDVERQQVAAHFPDGSKIPTFSPDGDWVVSGRSQGEGRERAGVIELWKWDAEERVLRPEKSWKSLGKGEFSDASFNADGTRFTTSEGYSSEIGVWDFPSGEKIFTYKGDAYAVFWLEMHPTKEQLAVYSGFKEIQLINYGRPEEESTFAAIPEEIQILSFSPDGSLLAAKLQSGKVAIIDPETGRIIQSMDGRIGTTPWKPNSRSLALIRGSEEPRIEIVEALTGKVLMRPGKAPESGVRTFFSSDGQLLTAVAGENPSVAFTWNLATGQRMADWRLPGECLTMSPLGKRAAVYLPGWRIEILNREANAEPVVISAPGRFGVKAMFTRSGDRIFIGAPGSRLTMHDATTGAKLKTYRDSGHVGRIVQFMLSPDEKQMLTQDWSQNVVIWDVESAEPRPIISLKARCADWSPDQDKPRLALGTAQGVRILTWSVEN